MKKTSKKSFENENHRCKESNDSEGNNNLYNELEETKKKLEAFQSRFNSLFERTNDAIILIDLETLKYVMANQKATELFGFNLEEIDKLSGPMFTHEDDKEDSKEKLRELMKGEILPIYVRKFVRSNGEIFYGEVNLSLVKDPISNQVLLQCIIRDITARMHVEQNQERDRLIFQKIANAAIGTTDIPEFCNRVLSDLLENLNFDIGTLRIFDQEKELLVPLAVQGLSENLISELKPMKLTDEQFIISEAIQTRKPLFAPDVSKVPELRKCKDRLKLFGIKALISWPILDKDKNILGALQLSSKTPKIIPDADRVLFESIAFMLTNALERFNTEKALEKAFQEREELNRTINLSPAVVFLWKNKEGWPVEFVSENIALYGYHPEDFYNEKLLFSEIMHPDDLQRIIDEEKEYLKDKNCNEYIMEYRILTKTKEVKWVYNYNAVQRDLGGNVTHFQGIILDTTKSKNVEDSLRNERRAFQIIADAAVTAETVPELCQRILDELIDALNFDIGSIRLYNKKSRLLEPIASVRVESTIGGEIQSISIDSPEYINALVARTKTAIFAPDITKYEVAQAYIERLRSINVSSVITWPLLDPNGDLLGILQLAAYEPKEIPEEDKIVFETISGTITNAIERLKAAEARIESEEKFRAFAEQSLSGVLLFNKQGEIIFINKEMENITEYPSEAMIQTNVLEYLIDYEHEKTSDFIGLFQDKLIEEFEELTRREFKLKSRTGKTKWLSINITPIILKEEIVFAAMIVDTTEQKQAQLALSREREILALISEATANNLYVKDLCRQILSGIIEILNLESGTIRFHDKNDRMLYPYASFGISEEEKHMIIPINIDDEKYPIANFAKNKRKIYSLDAQNDYFLKNFSLVKEHKYQTYISWPIYSASNELLGMIQLGSRKETELSEKDKTFFDTITAIIGTAIEHLQALENLKDSEERYKRTVDTLLDGITVIENNQIVYANERALEIFGYSMEELKNIQGFLDMAPESEKEKYFVEVQKMLSKQDKMAQHDFWITRKDGTKRYVRNKMIIDYVDGKPTNMYLATSDLTDGKKAEDSLIRERLVFKLVAEIALYSKDLVELTEKMSRSLMDVFMFEMGSIGLFDNESELIIPYSDFGSVEIFGDKFKPFSINDKEMFLAKVAREKKPYFIPDVEDSELSVKFLERARELKLKSIVAFPIISDTEELIGLLTLASSKISEITNNDFILFDSIIRLLATAIKKTLAEDELRKINEELELRVQQRTTQLMSVNKELEAFSYSVSHDLRTPLRSIDGFSQILLDDYSEVLDETGQDYLTRVRSACKRMSDLIDDLLALSRLTRKEIIRTEVNLSELVREITSEFQTNEPERKVKVTIEDNIKVQGDPTLVRTIMENLLSNAWKFTSKNIKASIDFGKKIINNEEVYFVQDNGVGFDKAYSEKLFAVFQRLHTYTEFKGTGIGLAIVQRIINRLGGQVWADSETNKGAIFYFTLPTKKSNDEIKM